MISRSNFKLIAGLLAAMFAMVWIILWLWDFTGRYDSDQTRGTLSRQMMDRKSKTMEDILDGMIREDYSRLDRGAQWMKAYSDAIEHFLSFPEYAKLSDEFNQSLDDLRETASKKDSNPAKEAVLRLERSCIECHILLNQRNRSPAVKQTQYRNAITEDALQGYR